jgi:type IV secretion system protein VirB4
MSQAVFDFLDRLLSDQIPIQSHVRDDVWLLDDGSVFALLELTPLPWETAGGAMHDDWKNHLNRVYKNAADDTVILTVYDCRGLAPPAVYPTARFCTSFAAALDARYRQNVFTRGLYQNRIYFGVLVRPPRYEGEFLAEQREIRRSTPVTEVPEDRIRRLEDLCAVLIQALVPYHPHRLGTRIYDDFVFSEMAEALVYALTGTLRPIPLTTGRLGEALLTEQMVVHRETIEFVSAGHSNYAAAFGMKHFPSRTKPVMFHRLLASAYRRTVTHTFRFVQTADAQKVMNRKHFRMTEAEDPAVSQAKALKHAADHLQSADWVLGDYAFTLLVFADTLAEMADYTTHAQAGLGDAGIVVARETKALEATFYAMIPGNTRLRPRPGYLSSLNFASLAAMHGYPSGAATGYWGPPAALFVTTALTPYRYHFHIGDVGNTFICGRVGSGKTALIGFLLCQAERYGATAVVFDYRRGLKVLCRTLGGSYAELRSDLAPLKALTLSIEDRKFLVTLIRNCILADGKGTLSSEDDRRLYLAVQIVMSLPPADRSMSEVRAFMGSSSINPNCAGARLDKWCHGHELGWILDNPTDAVRLDGKVIGFDLTHVLDDNSARGPAIAVLYHYASKLVDGRNLLFVIDEFWKSLLDPTFRALVEEGLRTMRKENAPMILATQSPHDALVSEIKHIIRDQCPTAFYFAVERPSWDDFGDQGMGLTETEFEIIRRLTPGTGSFLLKQGDTSVCASLPLGGLEDELSILSGRKVNTEIFDLVDTGDDRDAVTRAYHAARKKEVAE